MPCDVGYRIVEQIKVPVPEPQELKLKVKPQKIDQDLLEKIGESDGDFVEWVTALNRRPLLNEVLKRTLLAVKPSRGNAELDDDETIVYKDKFRNEKEKKEAERTFAVIGQRFQMELLKAVAQLLGYDAVLSEGGFKIIGEKESGGISKHLEITADAKGKGEIKFEHFANKNELEKEEAKFLALALRLGVKITAGKREVAGKPIGQAESLRAANKVR